MKSLIMSSLFLVLSPAAFASEFFCQNTKSAQDQFMIEISAGRSISLNSQDATGEFQFSLNKGTESDYEGQIGGKMAHYVMLATITVPNQFANQIEVKLQNQTYSCHVIMTEQK